MKIKICLLSFALLLCFINLNYGMEDIQDMDIYNILMSFSIKGFDSHFEYINIEVKGDGSCRLEYGLYDDFVQDDNEKSQTINFDIDKALVLKLIALYHQADFLNIEVEDLNKDEITVAGVGTTSVFYKDGEKERTLAFGYIKDNPLERIIKFYFGLAQQYLPDEVSF